jgi:hypothetical protein
MNVNSLFPSKYVAAGDLMGQDVAVVISGIKQEEVGEDEKRLPVLYFVGMKKGMVLNRTNAKRIAELYGAETDAWIGKTITLYPSETEYAGDTVPCLRVRKEQLNGLASVPVVPQPAPQAAPVPVAPAVAGKISF